MTLKVQNPRSKAIHYIGGYDKRSDANWTLCGVKIHNHYKETHKPATCQDCLQAFTDPDGEVHWLMEGDNDMPDAAFWAMNEELNQGGF